MIISTKIVFFVDSFVFLKYHTCTVNLNNIIYEESKEMRKLFVIIPFVMLLMSCAALYNGLEHGEKGVYLYKTYQHYKDEQIYCIGKCLVYSPHGVNYYEDSDVVVLNKTKQAFEDNEGCAVITENDSAYIQGAYSCSRYLDDNNISFVDSQKEYTVTGYVMHYTATSSKTPFLEITDGEKNGT